MVFSNPLHSYGASPAIRDHTVCCQPIHRMRSTTTTAQTGW